VGVTLFACMLSKQVSKQQNPTVGRRFVC